MDATANKPLESMGEATNESALPQRQKQLEFTRTANTFDNSKSKFRPGSIKSGIKSGSIKLL